MSVSTAENAISDAVRTPACLIIMDGFGLAEPGEGNAISLARTPNLDKLFAACSHTRLEASGEAVGLPAGQMGNSEVGHLNIGAGRVVFQELTRINRACADGSLAANPVLNEAFAAASILYADGTEDDLAALFENEQSFFSPALVETLESAGIYSFEAALKRPVSLPTVRAIRILDVEIPLNK